MDEGSQIEIDRSRLLAIIRLQTEISKLGLDLGKVLSLVTQKSMELTLADGAVVELVEGDSMVYRAACGVASSQLGLRLPLFGSLSGLSVQTGTLLYCEDSETDPRVNRLVCRTIGLRSMIVVPLVYEGQSVGVLKVLSTNPAHFSVVEEEILRLLSEQIGASLYFATQYNIDELYFRASHDEMTGLANRSLFTDRLRNGIIAAGRLQISIGIIIVDMDGLKSINDSLGHRFGDLAIRELALRINRETRTSDTAARLGGDEFGILLNPVEGPDGLKAFEERLLEQFNRPLSIEGQNLSLAASLGSSIFPHDSMEFQSLLDTADRRMYEQKRQRKPV